MPKRLSRKQIESFRADGFVSPVPWLSGEECDAFRARLETFEATHSAADRWALDIKANLLFDWVYELSARPDILDIAQDLIGADILLTNSIFRIKEADSSEAYGWHQDSARIVVEPSFVIVYLAVTEATEENGCLRVVPGTQRSVEPFDLLTYPCGRKVARIRHVDDTRAIPLILQKGEIAIFAGNAMHGSERNRSGARRIGFLSDYTPASSRQSIGRGSGQLVRGVDPWKHFAHEPVPRGSFTAENILLRREILTAYPENVLMGPREPGQEPIFADGPIPQPSLEVR